MHRNGAAGTTGHARIFVSAGEVSGDLHGANLIREVHKLDPSVRVLGYGGPRMRAAGQDQSVDLTAFSVMGLVEVLRRARPLLALVRETRARLESQRPDVVVLIDYPGLNFQIARAAKALSIPVLYYIIPQFWAWGAWRIRKLKRRADRALVILPFEPGFYSGRGLEVEYVGHPILDQLESHRTDPNLERMLESAGRPRLGILPGSRVQEIRKLLPTMLAIAEAARRTLPRLVVATPLPESDAARRSAVESILDGCKFPVVRLPDDPHGLMKASDVCLVASGTATLELACLGTPMIILYRVSSLARVIAPLLLRTPSIGLANVVAGARIVPEYLFSREPIDSGARDVVDILTRPERRAEIVADLARVRERIGGPGASAAAARAVLALLSKRNGLVPQSKG